MQHTRPLAGLCLRGDRPNLGDTPPATFRRPREIRIIRYQQRRDERPRCDGRGCSGVRSGGIRFGVDRRTRSAARSADSPFTGGTGGPDARPRRCIGIHRRKDDDNRSRYRDRHPSATQSAGPRKGDGVARPLVERSPVAGGGSRLFGTGVQGPRNTHGGSRQPHRNTSRRCVLSGPTRPTRANMCRSTV